jgi:hypothetical protein
MKRFILICMAVASAACEQRDPVAADANDAAGLPAPANANVSNPTGAPPPTNSSAEADPGAGVSAAAATVPAMFHGRWGLTPGDCTSTRGDNKGLLTVSRDGLRFYESRAVPVANVNTSSDSFSAEYAFSGEGMEWRKFQTLELQDDKLVRTESNPTTSYTYARCN